MKITKRACKSDTGRLPDYVRTRSKTASQAPGSLIGVKDKDDQSGTRPTPPGFAFVLGATFNESTDLRRLSDGLELGGSSYRRSQLGMTVRSPSPILALCRQLVESSTYASSTRLEALSR
jgi:hypothetical protein